MSRILWLDAPGGAAGDMILAALLDVGASEDRVRAVLGSLDLSGWQLDVSSTIRCGVTARRVSFSPTAAEPHHHDHSHGHEHSHSHGHEHSHSHSHDHGEETPFPNQPERTFRTIRALLTAAPLPHTIRDRAIAIFARLASAEARVHGGSPEDVHFHEVGSVDAILDIVGISAALDDLAVDRVYCGPLPVGRGWVRCAHGKMPLPAPATLYAMEGWATVPGIDGFEQVTPTGAAAWVTIGQPTPAPAHTVQAVGYGAGARSFDDRPNVVRAILGTTASQARTVTTTLAQVDDMTGEHIPPLIEHLLAAGALDVTVTPTIMKKGRPGMRVEAISRPHHATRVARAVLQHTTSFGVRQWDAERVELDRWHVPVDTPFGVIRIKVGALDGTCLQAAPEFSDVAASAHQHDVSVARVHAAAVHAWHSTQDPPSRTR